MWGPFVSLHLGGLWRPGGKSRLRGVWVPFALSVSARRAHVVPMSGLSLLVTCFGESAGRDGGRRPTLACRNLFRKGCFPHPVGRPRTVTVFFWPLEPRQIPPSPDGRALTGRLPQLAGPPSPPGKLSRTIRLKKPSPNTSGGAVMGCTCPQTRRSCQAVCGSSQRCCPLFCAGRQGPISWLRLPSPLRIGFGMCLVVCVFGCELIACCWFFHGRPLRNS